MPDERGQLTQEQKRQAASWLEQHVSADRRCPHCGTRGWAIADHLIRFSVYTGQVIRIGGPLYPAVALVCQHCGHFEFFNAIAMGLLSADEPKEASNG